MSEEIEYPSKERERAKVNVKVSAEVNTYLHDLYNQIQYEFCEQYEDEIKDLQKEKDRLNNIIDELEKTIENRLMAVPDDVLDDGIEEIKRTTKIAVYQVILGDLDKLKALKENNKDAC